MALAPVRPFRAWDFGDNVGIRVAFEKAPHKDHPDWTESALRYLGVRHVRTNATSPGSVTTIKRLHDRLGIRFHFTAIKPPTCCRERGPRRRPDPRQGRPRASPAREDRAVTTHPLRAVAAAFALAAVLTCIGWVLSDEDHLPDD